MASMEGFVVSGIYFITLKNDTKDLKSCEAQYKLFFSNLFSSGLIFVGISLLLFFQKVVADPQYIQTNLYLDYWPKIAMNLIVFGSLLCLPIFPFHLPSIDILEGSDSRVSKVYPLLVLLPRTTLLIQLIEGLSPSVLTSFHLIWMVLAISMFWGITLSMVQISAKRTFSYWFQSLISFILLISISLGPQSSIGINYFQSLVLSSCLIHLLIFNSFSGMEENNSKNIIYLDLKNLWRYDKFRIYSLSAGIILYISLAIIILEKIFPSWNKLWPSSNSGIIIFIWILLLILLGAKLGIKIKNQAWSEIKNIPNFKSLTGRTPKGSTLIRFLLVLNLVFIINLTLF